MNFGLELMHKLHVQVCILSLILKHFVLFTQHQKTTLDILGFYNQRQYQCTLAFNYESSRNLNWSSRQRFN